MAMSFYTDDETRYAIKILKERGEFNLSKFIKQKVLEESLRDSPSRMNLQYLEYREGSLKTQLSDLQVQLKNIQEAILECKQAREDEESEKKEKEKLLEAERINRVGTFITSIQDFFNVPKEELLELATEYDNAKEQFDSLVDFVKGKGYKMKDFEKEANNILAAKPVTTVPTIEKDSKITDTHELSEKNKRAVLLSENETQNPTL